MSRILIIDDDCYIGDMMEEVLRRENYQVMRAYSGTEALLVLAKTRPDLVLLDLMLPGLKGEEVLPKIKGIPVIVVSAKVDVTDKVKLLLGGAADYITKPFDISELLARITVQLRKASSQVEANVLRYQEIILHLDTHIASVENREVKLTRTEYAILKMLMQNATQVITKSQLLEQISMDTPDCTDSSLKMHVSNLRRKLRDINGQDYIEAVWGIGFKMRGE